MDFPASTPPPSVGPPTPPRAAVQQAIEICRPAAVSPDPPEDQWVPILERVYAGHAALTPPPELASVHAALVRSDAELLDVMRKIAAADGDQRTIRKLFPIEMKLLSDREQTIGPYLPGCA